ncbi:hypothetical protein GCM10010123_02040 [Pilimelia anulata]|uniref:Uncharacterized protein n=1 Tax=Pilimelia anulata TaxID=53371 RepID=A0A8J3AZ80_9ACTN|nr:hypothetical protein GCM10010123_02040 [Pilimelia anulata]
MAAWAPARGVIGVGRAKLAAPTGRRWGLRSTAPAMGFMAAARLAAWLAERAAESCTADSGSDAHGGFDA